MRPAQQRLGTNLIKTRFFRVENAEDILYNHTRTANMLDCTPCYLMELEGAL